MALLVVVASGGTIWGWAEVFIQRENKRHNTSLIGRNSNANLDHDTITIVICDARKCEENVLYEYIVRPPVIHGLVSEAGAGTRGLEGEVFTFMVFNLFTLSLLRNALDL